jgi:hypothetical protein
MSPYTKRVAENESCIDDAWEILDSDGAVIAILDTQTMADAVMDFLLGVTRPHGVGPSEYEPDVPYGDDESEDEDEEAEE